jgi:hypothetical protein
VCVSADGSWREGGGENESVICIVVEEVF